MAKQKFYVVWVGRKTGIFNSWTDCKAQVFEFTGAKYKSFDSLLQAEQAFLKHPSKSLYVAKSFSSKKSTAKNLNTSIPITDSIAVDAACSGNPGDMEYQGVETVSGELIFHQGPYEDGTNNIGEFLALVHALSWLKKQNLPTKSIYSDSKIAIGWIAKKKCGTKLAPTKKNAKLFELINRAESWLLNNQYQNPILKWETEIWGEIPADFGRK